MIRRRFVGYIALCALSPVLACAQAAPSSEREEIVMVVHKDPG